jgi:hypothetical protein
MRHAFGVATIITGYGESVAMTMRMSGTKKQNFRKRQCCLLGLRRDGERQL